MPLSYQHERNGELIPYRWGWWHAAVIDQVAEITGRWNTLRERGETVVPRYLVAVDPSDGEVMIFHAGDKIRRFHT